VKWVILVVIVVLGALLGYNWLTYGELTLLPPGGSEIERQVDELEQRLAAAKAKLDDALRRGKQAGSEVTREVAEARAEVARITADLEALLKKLQREAGQKADRFSSQVRERAARLQRAAEAFKRELE
jgi:cell division septum initiation protein DivIVA